MLLSPLTLILIAFVAVLSAFKRLQTWLNNRAFVAAHGCQSPPRFSRFQNILQQIKAIKSHSWLDMWVERYATIAKTFESATVSINPIIFTIDPENIKAILATDFDKFELGDRRRKLMYPVTGPGIFSNDGTAWRHSRALIRPNFTKMLISDLSTFETHFQHLLTALPPADLHSGFIEVDLMPLFFRMTLDSASETLLGPTMAFRSQLDPPGSASLRFMEAFDYVQKKIHRRNILDRGYMKPFGLIYGLWRATKKDEFEEACTTVHSILDNMILEFLRRPVKVLDESRKYVFLEEMARNTRDPIELKSEVLNVLMAGRDTTAALLTNTFFMLARRPDLWARIHTETEESFGGKTPDYETLRNMKQVRNLLSESLRLYPPVPFNARTATENITLPRGGGTDGQSPIFVKKGQQVNYHVYCLHRSPDIFGPDADVFRPDRWDDAGLRPGWGYIPFNGGARICLGQQFALTKASYVLVRIMQEFELIENRDAEPEWKEQISLVTKSRNGAKVALKRRERKN
ncbi:putative cytochrome P450 alkane hydroxylase [Lojkania enalia]|uniref:Cytochrome P450 alkane hydroxylase n=1 Tax=Lojkania enalia TaxID=147567 RepID=A0A9P4KH82_9PLEO|nr:putative cytochrome P450 alkane hydroxylase [Didymosphaeria enalia]